MIDAAKKAKAMSVHDRLLRLAKDQDRPFDLVAQRYAIERLLYRLAKSKYADTFVLKGAMVFLTWGIDLPRPTRDLDLMGFVPPDTKGLVAIFAQIVAVPVGEDGLWFNADGITAEQIREEDVYSGVRIKTAAFLGTMRISLQIDIGIGDALVPEPEKTSFPSLLGDDPPTLRSYSRYLVVAEKFEAMIKLGETNTRMKDFSDIWLMAELFEFDQRTLREAIVHTFNRRGTELPTQRPPAMTKSFHSNAIKQQQWKAFLTKARVADGRPSLGEACDAVWELVGRCVI